MLEPTPQEAMILGITNTDPKSETGQTIIRGMRGIAVAAAGCFLSRSSQSGCFLWPEERHSGSMSRSSGAFSRMELAKSAAKDVISTLTNADYLGVVAFSSGGSVVKFSSTLMPATADVQTMANDWVDDLEAAGTTSFIGGLEAAENILDASRTQERIAECMTVVLFLTDGVPNDDEQPDAIMDYVLSLTANGNSILFTYSLSADADKADGV